MGAISAGRRAAQRRRTATTSKRSFPYSSSTVSKESSAGSATETISIDSVSTVLTKLKSQVQETGGFFKKKQQALVEKVQKGMKMVSSTRSEQQAEAVSPADQKTEANTESHESLVRRCNDMIDVLEQMGFERSMIQKAMLRLRGKAQNVDEVVQVLLEMSSVDEVTSSGASSSNTFSVSLKRQAWDRLGIAVEAQGSQLVVEEITEGVMSRWNAEHPNLRVAPGDVIIDVNSKGGDPQVLVTELMSAVSVNMSISGGTCCKAPASSSSSSSAASSSAAPRNSAIASGLRPPQRKRSVSFADDVEIPEGVRTENASETYEALAQSSSCGKNEPQQTQQNHLDGSPPSRLELRATAQRDLVPLEKVSAPLEIALEQKEAPLADRVAALLGAALASGELAGAVSSILEMEAGDKNEIASDDGESLMSEVASKVVAFAFAQASQRLLSKEGKASLQNGMEERYSLSPVHGGA